MRKAFKFRIYPTRRQRSVLNTILETCCWVYNKTLEVRREAWKERQVSMSLHDTMKLLTEWRRENVFLAGGHAQAQQDAQIRVDLAFQHFFRRVKQGHNPGYPRFRGEKRYDSFTYAQQKGNWRFLANGRLHLSKLGDVKIVLHRPIDGTAKTLTISRDCLGNWWACFSCEVEPKPLLPNTNIIGVDLGLESFATFSTGEKVENPRFFRRNEKALAKAQRRGHKRAVQHIHTRIANRRSDFAHKLSRKLVNENQFIAFEDLNIRGMQGRNRRGLNKSISDAAWNQLVRYTTYKAEDAGRCVVLVDPRNTSQACSGCGSIVPKDLSVRIHSCPQCGLVLDRDHNAALNILARGLACISIQSVEAP